jgi:hypothetical protein
MNEALKLMFKPTTTLCHALSWCCEGYEAGQLLGQRCSAHQQL